MSIAAPRRLPWRLVVAVGLPDQRRARTAQFVAHRAAGAVAGMACRDNESRFELDYHPTGHCCCTAAQLAHLQSPAVTTCCPRRLWTAPGRGSATANADCCACRTGCPSV